MALIGLFLTGLLVGAVHTLSQEIAEPSSAFGEWSDESLRAMAESRRLAEQELAQLSTTFVFPEIANALSFPSYLIATARITSVELPKGGAGSGTRIHFHVEQMLRGESDVTDFEVESRWTPKPLEDAGQSFSCDGQCGFNGVLDRSEPKTDDRYVLGYTLAYGNGRGTITAFALDMQDPDQSQLVSDVERFVRIESASNSSDFETYLEELSSSVPWIRDIAVRRLSESDACNASPDCAKKFMAVLTRQLQSKIPNERLQAIDWMVWVHSESEAARSSKNWANGIPILQDSVMGSLLNSAVEDPNVYIGDQAFRLRVLTEFERTGKPNECIDMVPALRRSAKRLSAEPGLLPPGFPLSSVSSCVPAQKAADAEV